MTLPKQADREDDPADAVRVPARLHADPALLNAALGPAPADADHAQHLRAAGPDPVADLDSDPAGVALDSDPADVDLDLAPADEVLAPDPMHADLDPDLADAALPPQAGGARAASRNAAEAPARAATRELHWGSADRAKSGPSADHP